MNLTIRIFGIKIATIRDETPEHILPNDEAPPRFVRVADNEMNRTNDFWAARIGKIGRITEEHGGFINVLFEMDPLPCQDVDIKRFTPDLRM